MSGNRVLQDNDVSTVLHQVRVTLSRAERSGGSGPVLVEPVRADAFGLDQAKRHAELIVDSPSGSARPVVGPAITFTKRMFRRLIRWYVKPMATQQSLVNHRLVEVAENLSKTLGRIEALVGDLSMRVDSVERGLELFEAEVVADRSGVPAPQQPDLTPAAQRLLAYSAFEDRHRGSQEVVRPLLEPYLEYFDGCRQVIDLGCGRGEFVELLAERGIPAYGVDSDASQVAVAREAGRDVRLEDAITHLHSLRASQVDGVFSSQVAEHLTTTELVSQIELVHRKLAPGGVLVMETPNPEALFIFSTFFYVDLTHLKPIHPEALRWAFEACGFRDVTIVRSQQVPDSARLVPIPPELRDQPGWDVLGKNTDMLNDLIYGYQHYAVVGRKSEVPA